MPRVVIGPGLPDRASLDNEIARLRGLGVGELRARWHTAFRRRAPPHLPRHLLFHILAYRLQADRLGELDADSRRLLDRIGSGSSDETDRLTADLNRTRTELKPGTLLTREWEGHPQRVMVKRLPAFASLLYARSIPPIGGHTEFADERAAYDALPEETKLRLNCLIAEHSIFNSRARLGFTNFSDDERREMPPVPQVVVRTIPESGRKSLYLASHAGRIFGM